MQGSRHHNPHVSLKGESVWFKTKLISQFLTLSFLLTQPFYLSYLHAAPIGGEVVGGTGSISQSDLTTTINQSTQNLAVNWQSFDVNVDERVQFIQPDSSSIALNRILGNNGSTIQGQIDANGQVILVNPNGIFFTSTATINVGGLVASSLDMAPSDFMNGNYIFNEVLGTDGAVVNSGIINASVGGNVALIGKQVKNEGLITANLGSVILAAGKQSILTFDNQGLIGVQVTKEVLQEELGLEEAVANSGDINAAGGRVLLTASTSRDVFSQAVNNGSLNQATSVVVNDDGSFTLGGGADVLNTGSIDVSSETNSQNAARIILLGENVASSGSIKADTKNGNAGEIEIHAKNKALLIENSITSAQALTTGKGGLIKVLGDKVGLFDNAQVNASGTNGGGEVLIGGDRQGLNASIRNADFIYLGANTVVKADATDSGNGGKIITFAKDTARIHGNLFARGGFNSGNGGFIETSGLRGFDISNAPDVSAVNGDGGLWLIDPYNISIINGAGAAPVLPGPPIPGIGYSESGGDDFFGAEAVDVTLDVRLIQLALANGDVEVNTGFIGDGGGQLGNISFQANLDFNSAGNSNRKLILKAQNNIEFTSTSSITDSDRSGGSTPRLDLDIEADLDGNGAGNVIIATDAVTGINLFGGKLDIISAQDVTFNTGIINTNTAGSTSGGDNLDISASGVVTFNGATINTASRKVDIKSSSAVAFNGGTISTNGGDFDISTTGSVSSANPTTNTISTSGGNFTVDNAINFDSSNVAINVGGGSIDLDGGGPGVTGNVILGDLIANGGFTSDLTITNATSISQATGTTITIARNSDLDVTSGSGTHSIILEESTNSFNNIKLQGTDASVVDINGLRITGGTNVTNLLKIKTTGAITDGGSFSAATAIFDATIIAGTSYGNITLNNNNNFNNVKIINANNVRIDDVAGGIAIEANDGPNSGGIRGTLTINSEGSGDITDLNGVAIPNSMPAATFTGEINVGGVATFNVSNNSSNSITLDTSNNTFGSTVNFNANGGGSNIINNISITDDTALALPVIDIDGSLIVSGDSISFGHTHVNNADVGGILSATTTNASGSGTITQDTTDITTNGATTTLDATGDITLADSANNFNDVTIVNGGNVSLRDTDGIRILSSQTTGSLDIQAAGNILLAGDISTNNNATANAGYVDFNGNVILAPSTGDGGTITIDTNHATLTDGTITFQGDINNNNANASRNNLSLVSGDGTVDIQGSIGNNDSIASLVINNAITSAATVNLRSVNLHGESGGGNALNVTASSIHLFNNIDTNDGGTGQAKAVNLNGNVVLESDVTIDTRDSSSDGAVTISGTVNSDTTNRRLTITSQSGAVDLQSAVGGSSALRSLRINSGESQLGTVNLSAVTTNGGADVIHVDGTLISLNGNLIANQNNAGGDVTLTGNVRLNNSVTITSDVSGGTGGDGDVNITGNINSDAVATARALTIKSDNNNITLGGNVGNTDALQKVELLTDGSAGTQIDVNNITTTDITATTGVGNTATNIDTGVLLTAQTVNLGGNITSNTISGVGTEAGVVDINGATRLTGNVSINTDLAGSTTSDGSIDFSSIVNADSAGNNRNLTIDAGSATVAFNGNVGSTQELNGLTVNNAGVASLQNVSTRTGGIDVTSSTINLGGGLDTTALDNAGIISLVGNVNLNTSGTDVSFNTVGAVTDANITINGTVNNISSKNLSLDAGSADVSMTGVAGAGTALNSLTINGNNVDLGQVTSAGSIDVTGNSTIDLSGNLTSNTGLIDLQTGDVTLTDNITLSVTGANSVTVDGTINSDLAANDHSFTVNAGSGDVTLSGDIGLSDAVQGLSVLTSGTTRVRNINTRSGGVVISSDTLTLNGTIIDTTDNTTTAGVVTLTQDNLDLQANVTINTNSVAGTDGNISIVDTLPSVTDVNGNSLTLDAGGGTVSVNTKLINLSSFSVDNSLSTSLSGVETNDGQITVNANTNIVLNGNYDSGLANMSFNADADSNNSGLLNLTNTSSFSGSNINYSAASLAANALSIDAINTVTFNNTQGRVVLGDTFSTINYILGNAFLDRITATTLQVRSDNNYIMLNNASLIDNSYLLDIDAQTIYSHVQSSQLNNLNATATNAIRLNKGITALNDIFLNTPLIVSGDFLAGSTTVASTSGVIDVTAGTISGFYGLNLNAIGNTVTLQGDTTVTSSRDLNINANSIIHGNISATRNVNLISGGAYTQTVNSNIQSSNGNISITATTGNIRLASNTTNTGSITVNAVSGSILDNNNNTVNIDTAGAINLTAANGIGVGDPLEINSRGSNVRLTANNTTSGNIDLINNGNIRLENITNGASGSASDGSFLLTNTGGDVTINNLVLDKTSDTSVASFNVTGGDVLGAYARDGNNNIIPRANAHVTANSAVFLMNSTGSVGQLGAPLITDVPNRVEVYLANGTYIQFYGGIPPATFIGDNDFRNRALQAIESLSGQQLIEVESLAEIDPAIFTDVRNYNHSDIALMMPSDQRYTDDEEEDEEEKQKREKFLNSTN